MPWQARPAVASATTQARAYQLVQKYGGPHGEDHAAWDFKDVEESFRAQYDAWVAAAKTTEEIADDLRQPSPAERLRLVTLEMDCSASARRSLADGLPMTGARGVNVARWLAELLPAGAKVGEGGTPRRSDLRPVPHPCSRG